MLRSWRIGRHALVCGDARDPRVVELASRDIAPTMLVFDPPWDAGERPPRGPWASALAFTDPRRLPDALSAFGTAPAWLFAWDCGQCWYTTRRPLARLKLCLWYGDVRDYRYSVRLDGAVTYGAPTPPRSMRNARGAFESRGSSGTHLADLYRESLSALRAQTPHPHAKPLDWVRCLVNNCGGGVGGMNVLDPYAGSGTTLWACEATARRAALVEIDEALCERIVEGAVVRGLEVTPC